MSGKKEVWLDLVRPNGQQVLVRVGRRKVIARFYNHLPPDNPATTYEYNRDLLLSGAGWNPWDNCPEFATLIRAAHEELRRHE